MAVLISRLVALCILPQVLNYLNEKIDGPQQ